MRLLAIAISMLALSFAACGDDNGTTGGGKICQGGTVSGCKSDADCKTAPMDKGCDTATGICKMCKADADCSIAGVKMATGKCDSMGMCNKCDGDADCGYTGSTMKYCVGGMCRMCKADSDCSASAGLKGCDTATGLCSKCLNDGDCTSLKIGKKCSSGKCTCEADADCTAPATCK